MLGKVPNTACAVDAEGDFRREFPERGNLQLKTCRDEFLRTLFTRPSRVQAPFGQYERRQVRRMFF